MRPAAALSVHRSRSRRRWPSRRRQTSAPERKRKGFGRSWVFSRALIQFGFEKEGIGRSDGVARVQARKNRHASRAAGTHRYWLNPKSVGGSDEHDIATTDILYGVFGNDDTSRRRVFRRGDRL